MLQRVTNVFHSSLVCRFITLQNISLVSCYFFSILQHPTRYRLYNAHTLVTFARPTAQDNCVTVNVACTGRSPSNSVITISASGINYYNQQGSFPVGTSTVTCTATDGALSRTASCNFNVAVSTGMLNDGLKFEWILSRSFEIYKLYQNTWSQLFFPYFVENICTSELSLDLFEKLNQ